jgi:hypothetical protein
LAALFTIAVTGCGGGNSSTASTENNLPSPVPSGINGEILVPGPTGKNPVLPSTLDLLPQVSVGQRQFADPNVLLTLRGTAVAASGAQIVKTLWTQVTGPEVIIPSPQLLDNLILVPDVSIATQLEFRLTAQDSEGRINSATLSILVKPVPTFVKVIGGVFNESGKGAVFKIRLNAPSTTPVAVSYITQDATANSGSREEGLDYVAASGEIVFAAGEVLKEIPITLINDVAEEGDETFSLRVTAIDGTATHANTGVAIIRNGTEPTLTQSIQFNESGPITIYLGEQHSNILSSAGQGTGDIIYSSSDTSVATVNAQGLVTSLAIGTVIITATKFSDDTYLSASANYAVNVVLRGTPPSVTITDNRDYGTADGYSAEMGETINLIGTGTDQEDGSLPTQTQLSQHHATGEPIRTLQWKSDRDGFLGYGANLSISSLSQGTHRITYSVTDSNENTSSATVRVLVGNVAPYAYADASSSFCSNESDDTHCYYPERVNDTNLSTELGGLYSWVNEDPNISPLPQTVELAWRYPVTINSVDIYTTEGYVLRDYDIEYTEGEGWSTLISVKDNTETYRSLAVSTVTTYQLRVVAKEGSLAQPQHARINEIVVFGTMLPPDVGQF